MEFFFMYWQELAHTGMYWPVLTLLAYEWGGGEERGIFYLFRPFFWQISPNLNFQTLLQCPDWPNLFWLLINLSICKKTHRRQKTHNFFVKIWQIWSKNSLSCRKMLEEKKNSEKGNKKLKKDNKKLIKWKKLKKV